MYGVVRICLESGRVDTLADTSPLGQLWKRKMVSQCDQEDGYCAHGIGDEGHTVNALPVALLLLVEESVFVLGQHFLLTGHLGIPPGHGLRCLTIALEGSAQGINDAVHGAQTLALAGLLRGGQTPRGLPVVGELLVFWA